MTRLIPALAALTILTATGCHLPDPAPPVVEPPRPPAVPEADAKAVVEGGNAFAIDLPLQEARRGAGQRRLLAV